MQLFDIKFLSRALDAIKRIRRYFIIRRLYLLFNKIIINFKTQNLILLLKFNKQDKD